VRGRRFPGRFRPMGGGCLRRACALVPRPTLAHPAEVAAKCWGATPSRCWWGRSAAGFSVAGAGVAEAEARFAAAAALLA